MNEFYLLCTLLLQLQIQANTQYNIVDQCTNQYVLPHNTKELLKQKYAKSYYDYIARLKLGDRFSQY